MSQANNLRKRLKAKNHRKVHTKFVEKKTSEVVEQVHTTYVKIKKPKTFKNINPLLWPTIKKMHIAYAEKEVGEF